MNYKKITTKKWTNIGIIQKNNIFETWNIPQYYQSQFDFIKTQIDKLQKKFPIPTGSLIIMYVYSGTGRSASTKTLIKKYLRNGFNTKIKLRCCQIYLGKIQDLLKNYHQQLIHFNSEYRVIDSEAHLIETLNEIDLEKQHKSLLTTSILLEAICQQKIELLDLAGRQTYEENINNSKRNQQLRFINPQLTQLTRILRKFEDCENVFGYQSVFMKQLLPIIKARKPIIKLVTLSGNVNRDMINKQSIQLLLGIQTIRE